MYFYLIGVMVLLLVAFTIMHHCSEKPLDAGDLAGTTLLIVAISLTSWIGLIVITIYYLAKFISNKIKPKGN